MSFMTLKIPGIDGQSTLKTHEKELEILSFSHGISLPLSAGSVSNSDRLAGRAIVQDMSMSRYVDSASPLLMQHCAAGQAIVGDLTFFIGRIEAGAPLNLITYTLSDVFVSNYSISGGGDTPVENFTLNSAIIKAAYDVEKVTGGKAGQTTFSWDSTKAAAAT
ncbi:MAG: type VI secretion system tube protein Hcp [Pseudomonadota bacterium]